MNSLDQTLVPPAVAANPAALSTAATSAPGNASGAMHNGDRATRDEPAKHSLAGVDAATGAAQKGEDTGPKEFLWYLSRFFTRQFYAVFVAATVLLVVWPGASPALGGTSPWRLLLDITVYEVMLVDVLCKRLIPWKRPDQPRNGFPSGHATFSFAMAALVGVLHPNLAVWWLIAAVCVSWSRLYLRGHYFYQVAAGALFGFLLAGWVLWR